MKLGWITKFALAFGLRKTESFLATQPDLDADAHHDAIALAETLGSKTIRTALLAVACDLLKVVDAIRHGTATADDLATHASVLLAAGALMFFRHAIANRPEVVSRIVDVVKTPLLVALLLSASLAFAQTPAAQPSTLNPQPSSSAVPPPAFPQPQLGLNSNTVADIVGLFRDYKDIHGPLDFFGKVSEDVHFAGVYSFSPHGGLSSGGIATQWAPVWVKFLDCEFDFGPAVIVGSDKEGVFSAAEAAVSTKFIGSRVDALWQNSPLKILPVKWSGLKVFAGAGVKLSGATDQFTKTPVVSVGVGGIAWGN